MMSCTPAPTVQHRPVRTALGIQAYFERRRGFETAGSSVDVFSLDPAHAGQRVKPGIRAKRGGSERYAVTGRLSAPANLRTDRKGCIIWCDVSSVPSNLPKVLIPLQYAE